MQSPYMLPLHQRKESFNKKGGSIINKDLKNNKNNKLSLINKTFKQSELDIEVYETAEQTEEETLEMIKCPSCSCTFLLTDKKDCPQCGYKFKEGG